VLKPGVITTLLHRVERYVYGRSALITVHSEGNRAYIERAAVSADKVSILPNWVDTDELRPGTRDNEFARSHDLTAKFVVTFAGVLGISLGIELIAEAAAQIHDPDIHFLIVGNGAAEASFRARIAELGLQNVTMLPMQPKQSYSEILAASDLCLVMLRPDVKTPVVPAKINSIMAAGRPILASVPERGDAAELVRAACAGMVIPAGEAHALASAILRLRADPALRARYATNGREYAERVLSLDRAVTAVEGLLQRAAANHGTMT
jgi:colanic acid biosynthesis glycosyl transferase WcaI